MSKVDVVVLTKNSSITIDLVLRGIFKAIPVNELIIVDGDSTDSTLKIAQKYGAKIVSEKGRLGRARYRGASEVETEWFCFIDSDIFLFPFWYERLVKWITHPRVVWTGGLPLEQSKILESYAFFKSHSRNHPTFQKPVALSNSLLKTDVVLECTDWLREDIHAGEDSVLYDFVVSQGYRIVKDPSFFGAIHLPDCFLHDVYAMYRAGYSYRLRHKRIQIKYTGMPVYLSRKAFIGFLDTLDPRLFAYYVVLQGTTFLVKYLGFANRRLDNFMNRLEETSKLIGKNNFLNNSKKSQINHQILIQKGN